MAPTLLFDYTSIDLDQPQYDAAAVEATNPHRGDMRHLDAVAWMSDDQKLAIGVKDVGDDEFWVAGHIPGRPILPGVLMIEAAAQLASFVASERLGHDKFIGFLGADSVRFRGQVVPGDRLVMLIEELKFSRRRFVCAAQGIVAGQIVFEAQITGAAI